MQTFDAIVYGIIQGMTEFLPVSSSGHLALLPKIGSFKDPGVEFDLMMHFGTALAIILYFHKNLLILFKDLIPALFPAFKVDEKPTQIELVRNMVLTTIVTLVLALILKTVALRVGRAPEFIAFNLLFFGALLWLSDKKSFLKIEGLHKKFQFKVCLYLGALQALAIFPGVSRSGILLTGARSLDLPKKEASEFTFLLSLPIIFAGIIHKLPAIILGSQTVGVFYWVLGTLVSFLVGLAVIHFFMKFITKVGFLPFFIYRAILGILIFIYLV